MGAPPAVQRRGHPTPHHTSIGGGMRRNPHRLQRGCLCVCGGGHHTPHHTTSQGRVWGDTTPHPQGATHHIATTGGPSRGAETNTYLCICTHVHVYTYLPIYRKIKICIHNYVYANTTPHYKETWEGDHPTSTKG